MFKIILELLKEFAIPIAFVIAFIVMAILEWRDTQERRLKRNRENRYREVNLK